MEFLKILSKTDSVGGIFLSNKSGISLVEKGKQSFDFVFFELSFMLITAISRVVAAMENMSIFKTSAGVFRAFLDDGFALN